MKYLVLKTFAQDSNIHADGDILEMDAKSAEALLEAGSIEVYVEEKTVKVEVDTKGISDAVRAGLASLAPVSDPEKKGIGFGEFLQGIANKTINITTAAQGEAATEILTDPNIASDILADSGIASLTSRSVLTGTHNSYKFNVLNTVGNVNTVAESGTITPGQPALTTFSIDLEKEVLAYAATEESIEDTGALIGEINSQVPPQFAAKVEQGILFGTSNMVGISGHANTVSVAAESGQTSGTIVAANIDKMYCAQKMPGDAVWLMSHTAWCAVQDLEDGNGNALFRNNGVEGTPYGTLKGRPIVVSNYMQAVGTVGDIFFANMSKYRVVSKGALRLDRSDHVNFLLDESVFKFVYRVGGESVSLKWTTTDGTEISDFVSLAVR